MSKIRGFFLAASAVLLLSGAASAESNVLLASNNPARGSVKHAAVPAGLIRSATAQVVIGSPEYTDFDAVTSVNDQLYREGAKELLKQAVLNDAKKEAAPAKVLRDAPISKEWRPRPVRPAKARALPGKSKPGKPLHADPVKANNTF